MGNSDEIGAQEIKSNVKWILENYSNEELFLVIEEKISKNELLKKMVENISRKTEVLEEKEEFYETLLIREEIGNTSLGEGIALPHSRTSGIKKIIISMALLKNGVEDYKAVDDIPIKLVVMIGAPREEGAKYLQLIASVARIFLNDQYREKVLSSNTKEEFIKNVETF